MYIIRNSNNEIVAIATRQSDAESFTSAATIDKQNYTIEDTRETDYLENKALEYEDGIGEGQQT